MHNKYLLSIAIPTFNRAPYLDRCLHSIISQLNEIDYQIELLVVDNASTDHTKEIVSKYTQLGIPISYYCGDTNKGIDYNILQAYKLSTGKYVVAFGDDDVLYNGTLKCLKKHLLADYGIIYLENENVHQNAWEKKRIDDEAFQFKTIKSSIQTFNAINYYITYTSGCFINKNYFEIDYSYIGCFVALSPCIIKAIQNASVNLYVTTKCIGFQPENSGGYKVIDVFGKNLNEVMNKEINDKRVVHCINNHLLLGFFPIWMIRFKLNEKINSHFFSKDENPLNKLKSIYKNRLLFWMAVYPCWILPVKIAKQYVRVLILIKKMYAGIFNACYK